LEIWLIPIWKEQTASSALIMPTSLPRPTMGPNGATRGAATLGPLGSILDGLTPLDLLSGSMWVPGKDEVI
jgi:hypothetical protein